MRGSDQKKKHDFATIDFHFNVLGFTFTIHVCVIYVNSYVYDGNNINSMKKDTSVLNVLNYYRHSNLFIYYLYNT